MNNFNNKFELYVTGSYFINFLSVIRKSYLLNFSFIIF